jgi:hypothetical protein
MTRSYSLPSGSCSRINNSPPRGGGNGIFPRPRVGAVIFATASEIRSAVIGITRPRSARN